mgnify:CR=1 FL=1
MLFYVLGGIITYNLLDKYKQRLYFYPSKLEYSNSFITYADAIFDQLNLTRNSYRGNFYSNSLMSNLIFNSLNQNEIEKLNNFSSIDYSLYLYVKENKNV